MSLPGKFFPVSFCPYREKREIFLDFGKHLHVDLTENKEFQSQTIHPGAKVNLELSATTPTLPLSPEAQFYGFPFDDQVSAKLTERRQKAVKFSLQLPKMKYRLPAESTPDDLKKTFYATSVFEKYKFYKINPFVPKVNAAYTGGCLASLGSSQDNVTRLVLVSGKDFSTLKCISVSSDVTTHLLEQTVITELDVQSPVFEVATTKIGSDVFCAIRNEFGIQLFKLEDSPNGEDDSQRFLTLDNRTFMEERLTSISLSPFIRGEQLIATENGSLYLVKPGEELQIMKDNWQPRFKCHETWRQCYFAAHPRQFVTADRSVVKLYDSRTHFSEYVDLFALPNKLVHTSERIMVAKQQASCAYHHLVVTDAFMFVIDQRFPGHPLSNWSFSQNSPPQYISSCDISLTNDVHTSVIAVGIQHPPETYCYQVQFGGVTPLQTVTQPWRLSRIGDFSKFEKVVKGADMMLVKQRFNTSLVGLSICPGQTEHSLHTFQLDSLGELYFQNYTKQTSAADKTLSAGPGVQEGFLSLHAAKRGESWLQSLQDQFVKYYSSNPDSYDVHKFDSSDMILDYTAKRLKHELCHLCNSTFSDSKKTLKRKTEMNNRCKNCGCVQTQSQFLGKEDLVNNFISDSNVCGMCDHPLTECSNIKPLRESREYMEGFDVCETCSHSLKIGNLLYGIRAKNTVIGDSSHGFELFNQQVSGIDGFPHFSPNTQLLCKLWNGESDFMDLVLAREEERKIKKKEEKRILKLEKRENKEQDKRGDSNSDSEEEMITSSEEDSGSDNSDVVDIDVSQDMTDENISEETSVEDKEADKKECITNTESVKSEEQTSSDSGKLDTKSCNGVLPTFQTLTRLKTPKTKEKVESTKKTDNTTIVKPSLESSLSQKAGIKQPDIRTKVHKRSRNLSTSSSEAGFLATPSKLKNKDTFAPDDREEKDSLEMFSQFDSHQFLLNSLPTTASSTKQKNPFSKQRWKHISGF